jgi:RNA polymerase sigma-70 factor (ECF subfamily)
MGTRDSNPTGTTLFVLLREPESPQAWAAFVDRYAPQIYGWCRKWNLQHADAEDATQLVLAKLAQKIRSFHYERSKGTFRGWLKKLTRHAFSDLLESLGRAGRGSGDTGVREQLDSITAREDLVKELESAFDIELLEAARARVQLRVAPATWEVFHQLAMEGVPGADVAARFGMTVAAAYVARNRVQKMLREEIRKLEQAAGTEDPA